MKNIIIFLFVLSLPIMADDIFLKTGQVIKNVQIIEEKYNFLVVKSSSGRILDIYLDNVLKIEKKEFDPNVKTEIVTIDESDLKGQDKFQFDVLKGQTQKIKPYLYLLPISFLCWGLSWDYLKTGSDLQNEIKELSKIHVDISSLESMKNRKNIIGYSLIGIGILNFVFSLQSVDIKIMDNQLYLSYNF